MVVDLEWPSWNAIRSKAMQVDADPYIVGQFRGPANDAVPTRMTHRNAGPSRRKRCNSCGHDAHDAHDAIAGPTRGSNLSVSFFDRCGILMWLPDTQRSTSPCEARVQISKKCLANRFRCRPIIPITVGSSCRSLHPFCGICSKPQYTMSVSACWIPNRLSLDATCPRW